MPNAQRDQNRVPTLLGVSSTDGTTPVLIYADPITHRLYVDVTGSSSGTFNYELPAVGTPDGSTSVFTFTHTPGAILLNGATQIPGGIDITVSSLTVTFVTPPETGSTLYNQYLT